MVWTRLHVAIADGASPSSIASILTDYPKIARMADGGVLPLHLACETGAAAGVVSLLLSMGPDSHIRTKDPWGRLPLHLALKRKGCVLVDVVQLLMDRCPTSVLEADGQGRLPLTMALLHKAPLCVVESLMDRFPESVKHVVVDNDEGSDNDDGHKKLLPLHYAIAVQADASVVAALAARYPEALTMADVRGRLPLHYLMQNSNVETVRFLLEESPVAALKQADHEGDLPLHAALSADSLPLETVDLLLAHASPEMLRTPNGKGLLPFHVAIEHCHALLILEAVLAAYPEALTAIEGNRVRPALHVAVHRRIPNIALVTWLLEQSTDSIGLPDGRGLLPLHHAMRAGAPVFMLEHLLQMHPEAVLHGRRKGRMPLHHLLQKCQTHPDILDVLQWLLNLCPCLCRLPGKHGRLALHVALEHKAPLALVALVAQAYLPAVTTQDHFGAIPLVRALQYGARKSVVTYLVQAAPETLHQRHQGSYCLHHAVANARSRNSAAASSSLDICQFLVDKVPKSPMWVNADGRLPLHLACLQAHCPDAIKVWLVQLHPEALVTPDAAGRLPLQAACQTVSPAIRFTWLTQYAPEMVQHMQWWSRSRMEINQHGSA